MPALKYFFLIGVSLACSAGLFYSTQIHAVKTLDLTKLNIQTDNQSIKYTIEVIKNESKSVVIRGWTLNAQQTQPDWDSTIAVILAHNLVYTQIPTRIYERSDVIKQLGTSEFTKNSGFTASVMKKYIATGNYQIYLLLDNGDKHFLVDTHETLIL